MEHLPGACVIFAGAKHKKTGHGQKWKDGKVQYAHRIAAADAFGPCPEGLGCLHKCGVPACINPGHLYYGNQRQNNNDIKVQRGVYRKLTQDKADAIREDKRPAKQVAADYGISGGMVDHIRSGRQWQKK